MTIAALSLWPWQLALNAVEDKEIERDGIPAEGSLQTAEELIK